jgi:hypothetical protein
MLPETQPFRQKGWKLPVLASSCWEILLKAVGQPLGTAKRVLESCWEMPKGYWKASGQFLQGIGTPLGNSQIPAELHSSYWLKHGNFYPFYLKHRISV